MLKNWNIWRIIRLVVGLAVIYEAGSDNSFILYMIGGFLTMHSILNINCASGNCAKGQCEVNPED